MRNSLFAIAALIISFSISAAAKNPPEIASAEQLKAEMGAVRISVRSQLQYGGPLFVWFTPVVDKADDISNAFSIVRTQGVPFAGSNMIDSRPKVFALPPGQYRLLAHTMICPGLPPPQSVCTSFGTAVPTGRYNSSYVEFKVVARTLTDAGEFILELPPTIDIGGSVSYKQAYKQMTRAAIRWRKIAAPLSPAFARLVIGQGPSVPSELASALKCEVKPVGLKGMSLFYPFQC